MNDWKGTGVQEQMPLENIKNSFTVQIFINGCVWNFFESYLESQRIIKQEMSGNPANSLFISGTGDGSQGHHNQH